MSPQHALVTKKVSGTLADQQLTMCHQCVLIANVASYIDRYRYICVCVSQTTATLVRGFTAQCGEATAGMLCPVLCSHFQADTKLLESPAEGDKYDFKGPGAFLV